MKTITLSKACVMIITLLTQQMFAQSELICMNASTKKAPITQEELFSASNELPLGFINCNNESGALRFRVPQESTIISLLILSERGEVISSCPLSQDERTTVGDYQIAMRNMPTGKYFLKLMADYAVIDTRQVVKE
jgi:hypothetical protein